MDALAIVHLCALRAVGDTRFTLMITTVSAWGINVSMTLCLGLWLGWGAHGTYLGFTLQLSAIAAITAWRVRGIENGEVGRLDLLLGNGRHST